MVEFLLYCSTHKFGSVCDIVLRYQRNSRCLIFGMLLQLSKIPSTDPFCLFRGDVKDTGKKVCWIIFGFDFSKSVYVWSVRTLQEGFYIFNEAGEI